MSTILDTSIFWGNFLYYILESLVYRIIPKKKKNVAGKIVLITGAGSGLGRLSAITFASLGAILVLWDINEEGNMETCRMIKEKGDVKVFAYTCNCGHRQDVYRFADQRRSQTHQDLESKSLSSSAPRSERVHTVRFDSRTPRDCPFLWRSMLQADPLLLPILEQEYVAPKVLNAILEEQVYLIMPTLLHVVLLLKAIISPDMMITLAETLEWTPPWLR
ncbi:short-chain dehydrogenase/reductase family 16C member 6-like [Monodon monoceros]|uniref:short-chain dehydrogenase/reductase family 16C member 6-like n=1 Tax=Monodon monoceros TaxID=40151 RepID=UPI0010F49E22|nr:short-chain dehydrogenase/reductase family 16C member 6-like [Monodon monoceros]